MYGSALPSAMVPDRVGGQRHAPATLIRKEAVPIVQKAGWAPGPVWTGSEYLASNRNRFPDCSVRNKSLYRLSCPGAHSKSILLEYFKMIWQIICRIEICKWDK